MSWKWRMMQNLKRNWLVISKLAWGIWWILTRALESLKNFHFNLLLMSKVYIVWAKKVQRVIFHETEEGCKIWGGIDLPFKNWYKEFDKFWPERSKVSKIFTLLGSLWAKSILFELKKYRGVVSHETEEGYKICGGIDSLFQNWHNEFDKFWPEFSKISKMFVLMGSLWAKYILFELEKYRGIIFVETDEGYKTWRRIKLSFQNWHKKFDKFWPEHSKILQKFHFNGLLLSKVYIVWA